MLRTLFLGALTMDVNVPRDLPKLVLDLTKYYAY